MEFPDIKIVFSRCSIIINSIECPLPPILYDNANFLMDTLTQERSRSVCYHAGTDFLTIVASIIMGLCCLVGDKTTPEEVVRNLNAGDYVIYNGSRGIFSGFDENGRAIVKQIKQALPLINYIPVSRFHLIKPYHGEATSLDGRGIRGIPAQKRDFLSYLLGVDKSELPAEISYSVIIVTDRSVSDYVMKNTILKVPSGESLPLGSLFSAAYYTENDIYHYAGNIAKSDPVIKFTSKVSVARELIIEDDRKGIIGLAVCGRNALESGESELVSLFGRRSLPHICIIDRINSWDASKLIERFPETQLFAWTKPVMEQYVVGGRNFVDTSEVSISRKLTKIIDDICESKVQTVPCGSPISTEQYFGVRKALWQIAKFDYSDPEKERFVIIGFSLLKLFTQSIVSMQQFEKQIARGAITARAPSDQLKELDSIADGFGGLLSEYMAIVVDGLTSFFSSIEYNNRKFDYLLNCLMESTSIDQFTVIVPKESYALSFIACFSSKDKYILKRMKFAVSERFNIESAADTVISISAFSSKHFNPYYNIGRNISILTYDHEKPALSNLYYIAKKPESLYSVKNAAEQLVHTKQMEKLPPQEDYIDTELEAYINQVVINNAIFTAESNAGTGHNMVPICRIVLFESGQKAFLTKFYVAYLLDETAETVVERSVSDLQQGDYLIFKNFGEQAGDIVDELLQKLIANQDSSMALSEAYELSKRWKRILKEYMCSQGLSFRDVSDKLADLGHKKHEVTIRSWLNEEAHIVGPRDEDSFVAIALITGDKDISDNPQKYWNACGVIRSTRVRILRYIGMNIINSMGRRHKQADELLATIIGDVSELASLLRIESIVEPTNLNMPANIVNRPQ